MFRSLIKPYVTKLFIQMQSDFMLGLYLICKCNDDLHVAKKQIKIGKKAQYILTNLYKLRNKTFYIFATDA